LCTMLTDGFSTLNSSRTCFQAFFIDPKKATSSDCVSSVELGGRQINLMSLSSARVQSLRSEHSDYHQ
jgi:hypothetical protein